MLTSTYKSIILAIIGLILLSFSWINSPPIAFAQEKAPIEAPESLEEAKEVGERAFEVGKKELPGILEKIWQEEVLPIWQKMWEKWSQWWDASIQPWLEGLWQKIAALFGREIEKRKPQIEKEFEKEKEEMKEEIPKVSKSLWERFKELIK